MRAAVPRAVDQSSRRNKRNDRLAEGHERVAGAVMVLRMYRAPSIPALATVYFGAPDVTRAVRKQPRSRGQGYPQ